MIISGDYIVKKIRTRLLRKNQNCFILCQGDTGSGKSESVGLGLCRAVDPTFTCERVAYARPLPFLELLKNKQLKKGMAIMWDDAGLGMSAREFNTTMNRALSKVLQIMRTDNLLVVVTVPDLSMIDKHMKLLYHYQIDTGDIDYENNEAIAKFFKIENNRKLKKIYYKYMRVRKPNGKIVAITRFRFKRAPKDLRREYNKFRKQLTDDTKEKALEEARRIELPMKKKEESSKFQKPRCNKCGTSYKLRATKKGLNCHLCGNFMPFKEKENEQGDV